MALSIKKWLVEQFLNPKIDPEKLEQWLRESKKLRPVPLVWLFGKAQSGKTSIIRELTGESDAQIGQGFKPCTSTSRIFHFPD